ncbi:MAG: hypothetical protein IID30_02310 [Planctomycetes bacterium]|nr:hypothetical protein [Planctomycetota bacterium]
MGILRRVDEDALIRAGVRSLESLAPTLTRLQQDDRPDAAISAAVKRGYFTPDEDQHLRAWFARYLTARSGLLETIGDLRPLALPDRWESKSATVDEAMQLKCFAIAYAAACLLVQAARFLIGEIATHKITQRKLNEASPSHRIPSRQYTIIYRSMTHPLNAWRINEAVNFADAHRADLEALADDPMMKPVLGYIRTAEDALRVGVTRYFRARLRYRWHSWRRRRATAVQRAMFGIMESFGRLVADVRYWGDDHPMDRKVFDALSELLRPGDVIVMRHDHTLTNLFLPGFWPHVALHMGTESERKSLGVSFDEDRSRRAADPARVLEAKKDGVRFRPLTETLAVDSVAIIRPTLDASDIAEAISRAARHEGKLYNFDFDFFNDEKLVCTEVVYRAYDGVGSMHFDLSSRGGRMTISAEDLLDMAVEGRGFEPVAVFGAPGCETMLVLGPQAHDALARTYREKESL